MCECVLRQMELAPNFENFEQFRGNKLPRIEPKNAKPRKFLPLKYKW